MKELFKLGGNLSSRNATILAVIGFIVFMLGWQFVVEVGLVEKRFLPAPSQIFASFPELIERGLLKQSWYSIKLNLMGYGVALFFALPLGFILGLSPLVRGLTMVFVKGAPYLPLTAMTMLFIIWFGIYDKMKVSFLAFAIFVYLLPIITQKVMETSEVYINTAKTLGASNWQLIRNVYIPDTLSRAWDDIVVLVAISWTYIIIAELINRTGGIGSMIYLTSDKIHRYDMTFALLFVLIFIGFSQDRIFRFIGKLIFPFKKEKTW